MKKHSLYFLFFILFTGCSIKYDNNNLSSYNLQKEQISLLENDINKLSKQINKEEAKDAAFKAISFSKRLANDYDIVSPPLFHNLLVNMNIKEKGYCYHFANDLMEYLKKQNYKSFKFIRIVANKGEYFEHGSVLLTRDDIKFENSLVLDAWRNSGELFFIKIKEDKIYKWEKR